MEVNEKLSEEARKWLVKAKEKRNTIKTDSSHSSYLKNIDAYISDSEHFLKKGDLIRSFEAVIWAWAWIEILKEMKILKAKD